MTRDEIEKAAEDFMWKVGDINTPNPWTLSKHELIDFALDMVRRHNEELEKMAKVHVELGIQFTPLAVRQAKP